MMSANASSGPQFASTAYNKVQQSLGQPVSDLQVDTAMSDLREQAEYLRETVGALLRRLSPVLCDPGIGDIAQGVEGSKPLASRAPLAVSLENVTQDLRGLTGDLNAAIRALQV